MILQAVHRMLKLLFAPHTLDGVNAESDREHQNDHGDQREPCRGLGLDIHAAEDTSADEQHAGDYSQNDVLCKLADFFERFVKTGQLHVDLHPALCKAVESVCRKSRELGGAAYLFIINAYFITLSSAVILSLLRIPKVSTATQTEWKRQRIRMIRNTALFIIPAILIVIITIVQNS